MTPEEGADKQAEYVARIDAWSPQPEISAMKARRLDRGSQFAVVASLEALRQSGFWRRAVRSGSRSAGIEPDRGHHGVRHVLLTESPEAYPRSFPTGPSAPRLRV
jgi:3-oxoacyl-(acyl-carrier-protein) synthase